MHPMVALAALRGMKAYQFHNHTEPLYGWRIAYQLEPGKIRLYISPTETPYTGLSGDFVKFEVSERPWDEFPPELAERLTVELLDQLQEGS